MSAAETTGVIPPVKMMVEASRFTEFRASMMALASGAPRGTWLSSRAWS